MPKVSHSPDALLQLGFEACQLWADAAAVVMLRSSALMQGGAAAEAEAGRMVREKVHAGAMFPLAMWPLVIGGAAPATLAKAAIGHYQKPVGANRRRLSKKA